MNRLEEILAVKRAEIEQLRPQGEALHQRASRRRDFRQFGRALKRADGRLAVIAEIKKASPSAGLIAEHFDAAETARSYQRSSADAISVLTDRTFFGGSIRDLEAVVESASLPVLRKDFILDEIQVTEAAAGGADAILLIVAALEQSRLEDLLRSARQYRIEALVEVHTADEMARAADAGAAIIGINNRNLATFEVDLAVTEQLRERSPNDAVLVSESGIRTTADAARIRACGVDAILVGEALMRGSATIEQLRRT